MPQVTKKVSVRAPFDLVWEIAQNVEEFPNIMPELDKVEVLEKSQTAPHTIRTVTQWTARIPQFGRTIEWTEEDIWNREEGNCHFWQIKGDFTEYKGIWKFRQNGDETEVDLAIDYAFEIPLVGALMKKVMQKLMQGNADMMADALKAEAEKQAGEG